MSIQTCPQLETLTYPSPILMETVLSRQNVYVILPLNV